MLTSIITSYICSKELQQEYKQKEKDSKQSRHEKDIFLGRNEGWDVTYY